VVLTKRERYTAILTGIVLGALVLYWVAIGPLLDQKTELDAKINDVQEQLDHAKRLFDTSRAASRKWEQLARGGLRRDESEAESQILNNIREWAQDARMALSSVKPERTEKEKEFVKTTFRATGAGGMGQVGRFLWRIQTAAVPVRVTDVTITTHKEGTDDLTVSIGVATIYQAPEAEKTPQQRATPAAAAAAMLSNREIEP